MPDRQTAPTAPEKGGTPPDTFENDTAASASGDLAVRAVRAIRRRRRAVAR
ncbi:hypothetical protein [Streptomyces rapamycinicus]|uniref:Uncharacterized protein n=2 Tax=Streptomyces rapamycinicus TaxID=1226757 RepID=A0A0A0NFU0_STRRN|nr:hypothetical protein [Streptomyces rapamycinicus]AGP53295.1 hypothetical protein M271_08375 [Streptomyces rapamycinicus NRRL 5491]MBB4780780.1 hypothetical protein [Streptomyces rapamycinicus]RLV74571.1 hypothetical protein D3C57_135135 [Streptomyces rapamycinicus NRRL 5491]UTO61472.1 hypothetical protein LJB45_03420 [Streptomyces rapamycinicus]UTP29419.1 hypothetical protein LIV37_08540 [Streptomyces rapamycinicus NRRL 5491]